MTPSQPSPPGPPSPQELARLARENAAMTAQLQNQALREATGAFAQSGPPAMGVVRGGDGVITVTRRDGTKGDLLSTVHVQVPGTLDAATREAVEAYRAATAGKPLRANLFQDGAS